MTINEQENACLINHFVTLQREIALEKEDQLITIARVIGRDAQLIIDKLRLLNKYEKEAHHGKAATGASKEAATIPHRLHQPGHTTMLMRTIPDKR